VVGCNEPNSHHWRKSLHVRRPYHPQMCLVLTCGKANECRRFSASCKLK
jgi:hypothetical protein